MRVLRGEYIKDKEYISNIKKERNLYSLEHVALNKKEISRENIDALIGYINSAKRAGKDVNIAIDFGDFNDVLTYSYSKEEMNLLNELNNALLDNGYKSLVFVENKVIENPQEMEGWSFEQVVNANTRIDNFVERIKGYNLSPFETVLYVHAAVSKFMYSDAGRGEQGRVLPSILNSTDIVCAGYTSMMKAILDKLNVPGLKCDFQTCSLLDEDGEIEIHSQNLIHIKDPKYNINGTYINDACWDSRKDPNSMDGVGFAHCLYPISDLERFNEYLYSDQDTGKHAVMKMFDFSVLDGPVEKAIKKIKKTLSFKKPINVVKKYGSDSKAIDIEKYKEALRVIYSIKHKDPKDVEKFVERAMNDSISMAMVTFKPGAQNTFVKNKNKIITNVGNKR